MVVLLRVLAIWELIHAVAVILPAMRMYSSLYGMTNSNLVPTIEQYAWSVGVPGGIHLLAGIGLLWFAVPLSRFFYPREVGSLTDEQGASISFAERIAQIPAEHRLRFWICAAGFLTLLNIGMAARSKAPLGWSTLHTLFLIALGCSAAAFLLRKTLPFLEGFLAAWSLAFAMYTAMFALRLVP
jgi:hypothetical protein